jgi:hypothetical protein
MNDINDMSVVLFIESIIKLLNASGRKIPILVLNSIENLEAGLENGCFSLEKVWKKSGILFSKMAGNPAHYKGLHTSCRGDWEHHD